MNNIEQNPTDQNIQTPLPENQAQYFDSEDKSNLLLNDKEITPNGQDRSEYINKVCKIQNQYRKHKQINSLKVNNTFTYYLLPHLYI